MLLISCLLEVLLFNVGRTAFDCEWQIVCISDEGGQEFVGESKRSSGAIF